MRHIISTIFIIAATQFLLTNITNAQLNTLSPYTRYGLGDINQEGYGRNDAMGSISAPLHTNNVINPGNPASYSRQDSLSFIFDVGLKNRMATYKTSSDQKKFNNAMLDHVAIGFPITPWFKVSSGIYPFSHTGYKIQEYAILDNTPEQDSVFQSFSGEGGLNSIYFGSGFSINKNFSVGLNMKYVFGKLEHLNTTSLHRDDNYFITTDRTQQTEIRGLYFDAGLQYYANFENSQLTIGAFVRPESNLTGKYDQSVLNTSFIEDNNDNASPLFNDTLVNVSGEENLTLPLQMRIGAQYSYDNRLIVAAEYELQQWSSFEFTGIEGNLQNSNDYRIGLEYIPDPTALTGYLNHVFFRAGGYFSNTYLKINDEQITDRGVTLGLGLPFRGSRTTFNISYRFGMKGTTDKGLMQESYNQFKISLSMYDVWFVQRKYD